MKISKLTIVVIALVLAFVGLQIAGSYATGGKTTDQARAAQASAAAPAAQTTVSDSASASSESAQAEKPITDLKETETIERTLELKADAEVEISGVNGALEITTTNEPRAILSLVRSAENRGILTDRALFVESSLERLLIENPRPGNNSIWDNVRGTDELRTRMKLSLPRRARLSVYRCSGTITIGAFDAPMELDRLSGRISLAQATGRLAISRVSGRVDAAIKAISGDGVELNSINGPVRLTLANDVSATINANRFNGALNGEGLEIKQSEQTRRGNFTAMIGAGGPIIFIGRVNGNVTLVRGRDAKIVKAPPAAVAR